MNGKLAAYWVERGDCDLGKAREKLVWMCERVRLERAQGIACELLDAALKELGW